MTKPDAAAPVKYRTPLREAQRDLTRSRIKDAARELFYERHYDSTTMDEIAVAAGLRRSTLYLHYKDKAEILGDVIADYTPKARAALEKMPGPHPTVARLLRWVGEVAKVVERERAPLSIILELRRSGASSAELEALVSELLAGLGKNNPGFRAAADPGAEPMLRARALLLLQELTYACGIYLDAPQDAVGKAALKVTAANFHTFLSDHPMG